jgi:hypothetical protein
MDLRETEYDRADWTHLADRHVGVGLYIVGVGLYIVGVGLNIRFTSLRWYNRQYS